VVGGRAFPRQCEGSFDERHRLTWDAATTNAVDRPDGTDTLGMKAMAMAQALVLVTTGSDAPIAPACTPRAQAPATPRGRSFTCCPETGQIAVIDAAGRLCEVFGEAGAGPGQFDQPSHVIVVSPRFEGEDAHVEGISLVAVADRGNNRVQIFEPEGQLVAIIGATAGSSEPVTEWRDARGGWPFFRVGGDPRLTAPVRLEWADPLLVVVGADGSRTPIDLAAALLPSFDAWLGTASRPMLASAHHHFRHKVRSDMLAAPLAAIETALGIASLEAGDADAAARLWSLSWPAALGRTARASHADVRDRAGMAAAFRLGGIGRVAAVRAAIRQSLGAFALPMLADGDRGGPVPRRLFGEAC
jgi:hypothetical protein